MRVIGGTARGRKLSGPHRLALRPTADNVREALFNIIGDAIRDARFLDVFAGTGAVGIEALSRGAAASVFVESHSGARKLIWDNLTVCDFHAAAQIIPLHYETALHALRRKERFDFIFADPPYDQGLAWRTLQLVEFYELRREQGIIILETSAREAIPDTTKNVHKISSRVYSDSALHFFSAASTS